MELQWFAQFSLQSVLFKRWALQTASAGVALGIAALCAAWRRRWLRLSALPSAEHAERDGSHPIEGWRFGAVLLLTVGAVLADLVVVLRLVELAWSKPYSLGQWWEQPFSGSTIVWITAFIVVMLVIMVVSRRARLFPLWVLGSLGISFVAARAWGLWTLALLIPLSGTREQLLGSDISFGLGQFSAVALAMQLVLAQLLLTVGVTLLHRLSSSHALTDWSFPGLNSKERHQLQPMLAALLLLCAGLVWLSRHQLLWSQDGIVAGAGWLDVHLLLPLRQGGAIALLASALLVLPWSGTRLRRRWRRWAFAVAVLCWLGELTIAPGLQWLLVRPRELRLEHPYLGRAIEATRQAFQLDAITTRSISPSPRLTPDDLVAGASTLRNIRLWDSQPLLASNRQLQQLRVYYRFSEPAVDRYQLTSDQDQRQQVIIAARELDQAALPDRSRTWLNRHFVFTHGFGFTLSPVNTRAPDGLPDYFISDLGKATRIEGHQSLGITRDDVKSRIPIGRAALYFGLLPSPYAIAPTLVEEFDYPEGDENTYNHYTGSAGIPLESGWHRIAAALYLREPRLLNTGSLLPESKLLIRRDIRQRVQTLAPFLEIKGDPYLVSVPISEGTPDYDNNQHQYWVVDGYTTSKTYPYSASLSDGSSLRYVRNSVKAIVDAYNGSVHLYVSEPDDPMIQGWQKIFPEMFRPLTAMPTVLQRHLMVPRYLFEMQVQQLLRYHVTDPRIFYSGDDVWQVPMELYGKDQIPVAPYHITAQLTPSSQSEFLLLQPLTPLARPNLSGWLAARSDGEHYGELVLLRFPSDLPIFGPEQIQALINQNPMISQQFGLWDRAGSEVVQGNLLVLPMGKALLYVEPVYLRAKNSGLPALTRVVVSDGSRVAMAGNLLDAIQALMGEKQSTAMTETVNPSTAVITR